ncbi:unnamed protein product [Boreogadus saida]
MSSIHLQASASIDKIRHTTFSPEHLGPLANCLKSLSFKNVEEDVTSVTDGPIRPGRGPAVRRPSLEMWCRWSPQCTLLLSLLLLTGAPPHLHTALLPAPGSPALERALLRLLAPGPEEARGPRWPRPWGLGTREGAEGEEEEEEEEEQRGRPVDHRPADHRSPERLHLLQERGEEGGEAGGRKEALLSMAGGLQAFSREKGGFGFRFGRGGSEEQPEEEEV